MLVLAHLLVIVKAKSDGVSTDVPLPLAIFTLGGFFLMYLKMSEYEKRKEEILQLCRMWDELLSRYEFDTTEYEEEMARLQELFRKSPAVPYDQKRAVLRIFEKARAGAAERRMLREETIGMLEAAFQGGSSISEEKKRTAEALFRSPRTPVEQKQRALQLLECVETAA